MNFERDGWILHLGNSATIANQSCVQTLWNTLYAHCRFWLNLDKTLWNYDISQPKTSLIPVINVLLDSRATEPYYHTQNQSVAKHDFPFKIIAISGTVNNLRQHVNPNGALPYHGCLGSMILAKPGKRAWMNNYIIQEWYEVTHSCPTVYPKKYAHGFVVLCFVVVMQSFIMNSHIVFIHIHQGCFACTGAIVRLPQCQWSKLGGYGKISQCITATKQKPCAYFLGYTVASTAA